MTDPIRKSVHVPLTAEEAFTLFTQNMDLWWPKAGYSVKGPASRLIFPRHKDEEIIEEGADGSRAIWGKLIAYEPGRYVAFTWHPGKTEAEATVVEMRFTPTAEGTQCDLTHGGFDVLGDLADAVSTSYLRGWDVVLGCYCSAVRVPVPA